MDFLKIRKKARERSQARAQAEAGAPPPAPAAPSDAAERAAVELRAAAAPARPVVTAADVLEGELAARLQGLPPSDEDFTTWRPGSGAPPPVDFEPLAPVAGAPPEPRREDFAVVTGLDARPSPLAPKLAPLASAEAGRAAPAGAARGGAADPLGEFFYREDEEAPEVPVGGPAEEAAREDPDAVAREEYLTFLLGREEYAVAIERVREVLKAPPITEVPRAPAHVLGVVTVRGEVVAVLDPRRRLGLPGTPPAPGTGRIVIVDAGEGPCGLLVDAVASVVRLRPGTVEPCPQGLAGASADCLAGIGREGERLFTVLDLGALFRRSPPAAPRRAGGGDRRAGA